MLSMTVRDLELWRRLVAGSVAVDELRPLRALVLAQRAPYLGHVLALASHADPALRAAALEVLAGCRGVPGVRALVAALDDDDDSIRTAGLAALHTTARDAPMRFAHALFHPRIEVRRAALTSVPRGSSEIAAYLRADPACGDLARTIAWPAHPLPLAFDLRAAGQLTASELVNVVVLAEPDLRGFLIEERGRDADIVDAYLATCLTSSTLPVAEGDDVIDLLIAALDELDAEFIGQE